MISKVSKSRFNSLPVFDKQPVYNRNRRCTNKVVLNVAMQSERAARPENVSGDFFVDHTCIDCDTCRWMNPEVFQSVNGQTAVVKQPDSESSRKRAMQALIACPTYSIHMTQQYSGELNEQRVEIPTLVEGCKGVYHNGYHSESTFACASWLILRPDGAPIMFDVPRFDAPLVKQIEKMGGVKYIIMSHRDDVGDHEKWAAHFGAKRIIHKTELGSFISEAEILLEGEGPWLVDDQQDLQMIHVPGHTEGSIVLYRPSERVLFTGDHFAMSGREGQLTIFPRYNRYGVDRQLASVDKLKDLDVKWILPGHGRPVQFQDKQDYQNQVEKFLEREGYKKQRN